MQEDFKLWKFWLPLFSVLYGLVGSFYFDGYGQFHYPVNPPVNEYFKILHSTWVHSTVLLLVGSLFLHVEHRLLKILLSLLFISSFSMVGWELIATQGYVWASNKCVIYAAWYLDIALLLAFLIFVFEWGWVYIKTSQE